MTEDEVKEYITQIAFSGATDFISKYQDQFENGNDIIGHFGLGFYSAFMVADKVEIDTSYKKDAKAVKWVCDSSIEYKLARVKANKVYNYYTPCRRRRQGILNSWS